jgi:hypothetical protein
MKAPSPSTCLFLLAIMGCATACGGDASRTTAVFNQGAAVLGEIPMNPLAWRVITSFIDPGSGTMSTLYGNDLAVEYARTHSQHDYPVGSVLSLVTWTENEDPRWYGAKIPSQVKSVEFVTAGKGENGVPQYSDEIYAGSPLKKVSDQQSGARPARIEYLLSSRAAVMP